jgi:chromosome segregation ATPase
MKTRVERRLADTQRQLERAREDVRILEEQVATWNDTLEELRVKALVSETPLQSAEYNDMARHVTAARDELQRRRSDVSHLNDSRDALLREWAPQ